MATIGDGAVGSLIERGGEEISIKSPDVSYRHSPAKSLLASKEGERVEHVYG